MNRLTILNLIAEKTNPKTYLEIGVQTGKIISKVNCANKIGVDPDFQFSNLVKAKRLLGLTRFKKIEVTSDDFFAKHAKNTLKNGVDLAFIDGLHTYEQTKIDVENCLQYLNDGGIIVMHDCNPLNYAGAYPVKNSIEEVKELARKLEMPGWNGSWNGDVWKTVADLLSTRKDLNIFTLDMDWGLGVITKGTNQHSTSFSQEDIKNGDFSFLEKNREQLLNLKPPKYIKEFLNSRGK